MYDGETNRRSQNERTAATIARLLDATISAIVDIGYSRATVREICARAGVSQGGLFRHFPTRKDLLVATLAELHERQIAAMSEAASHTDAHAAIARMRDVINAPDTTVWLELCVAARTDTELGAGLRPLLAQHHERLRRIAEKHPGFAALSTESQLIWLDIAERVFQAEALWRQMAPPPDLGEARLDALIALLDLLPKSDVPTRGGAG
jgi:AcrR family transcriptional regulator